jgi:hypothetical protein
MRSRWKATEKEEGASSRGRQTDETQPSFFDELVADDALLGEHGEVVVFAVGAVLVDEVLGVRQRLLTLAGTAKVGDVPVTT